MAITGFLLKALQIRYFTFERCVSNDEFKILKIKNFTLKSKNLKKAGIILTGLKAQLNTFHSEHEALRTVRNGGVLI